MTPTCRSLLAAASLVLTAIPIAACDIDVRKQESAGKAEVDIQTPVGDVSVRTGVDAPDTGLKVYPGARPLVDEDEAGNADVNVGNSLFGVKVVAAKYESADAEEKIIDFYKNEMQSYGDVTECRGNVDFRGSGDNRRPVCREKHSSRDLQLVVGPEDRQRIVSITPRGSGTEFALVYLQTRGTN
jgi:hypothetical protein